MFCLYEPGAFPYVRSLVISASSTDRLVLINVLCGLPVPPTVTVHKWRRILLHGCNKYEVPTGPKVNLREVIINQLLYKLELHAVLRFISAFATARH